MKILHLRQSKEFSEILRKGKKVRGKTITLFQNVRPIKEMSLPRVGVIISKKAAGKAVRRNYIKRLVYSFFQTHGDLIKEHYDIVIRVSRDVRKEDKRPLSVEILEELEKLTKKAGLVK